VITQSRDTSPEAERVLIDLLRRAPPWKKFAAIDDTTRAMRELALIGLKERHPRASPEELRRRLAGLLLGEDLAERVFGPLPDTEGA